MHKSLHLYLLTPGFLTHDLKQAHAQHVCTVLAVCRNGLQTRSPPPRKSKEEMYINGTSKSKVLPNQNK